MEKPNLPQIYPSAARPSLVRSAAFRPLLMEGLALSGESLHCIKNSSYKYQKNILCQYRKLDYENYFLVNCSHKMGTLSEAANGGN